MKKFLGILALCSCAAIGAELEDSSDIKFAIYSSAWGENTDDGLRIIAQNRTDSGIRLEAINFLKDQSETDAINLVLNLDVPAGGYADMEVEYIDLLGANECIERTMSENWKLVEVSNYTLNPSVRNLIIEDTDSFRIYQCVENIVTSWTELASNHRIEHQEWVLFHFETRSEQ